MAVKIRPILPIRRGRFAAIGLLLLATAVQAHPPTQLQAPADVDAAPRAEFQAAYALAAAGLPAGGTDSVALQAYPLYPYLQAMRLQRQLQVKTTVEGLDTEIAAFFTANGDALAGRDLRRAWLNNLAERQIWPTFLENYNETVADAGLRCHLLTARAALGHSEGLAEAISEIYQSGQKSPACDAPFDWLDQRQLLTAPRIERRVRALLKAGDARSARSLAARLSATQAAPLLQWAALIENPQAAIDALIAAPQRPVEADALLDGWTRFARRDADAASARFDALVQARHLDAAGASPLAAALGLALSWNRDPDAGSYFARVLPADTDEKVSEWSIRTGNVLRSGLRRCRRRYAAASAGVTGLPAAPISSAIPMPEPPMRRYCRKTATTPHWPLRAVT
jgi:soluble lytic murein transglycosylase